MTCFEFNLVRITRASGIVTNELESYNEKYVLPICGIDYSTVTVDEETVPPDG